MSRERYVQALNCENPAVIPHQLWLHHGGFITDATGIDYYAHPREASLAFHERFDVDNGGPIHIDDGALVRPGDEGTGRVTGEGFETVWHNERPFVSAEELWDFDPDPWGKDCEKAVEPNYATRHYRWCFDRSCWSERLKAEERGWQRIESFFPGKFTDASTFYCTALMWGICIFGWEVFLEALAFDADKTGEALGRISEITARMYEYFSMREGSEFVTAHDDLCMTSGPITDPGWYRRYIYPLYERIFGPVREAGKKVILLSDGNISRLAGDAAGLVDGFIFESATPFEFMADHFGKDKCLIGGIDGRVLTFGNPDDVAREVGRAVQIGSGCPGYILACANTIPGNVPLENVYEYFRSVEQMRHRVGK